MAEEKSPNPEAEVAEVQSPSPNPNAGESGTPSEAIEHAPSSDEPLATDFPSSNVPAPEPDNPQGSQTAKEQRTPEAAPKQKDELAAKSAQDSDQSEDKPAAKKPAAKAADDKKPDAKAAKAKKEKAPALEDKPFTEFIEKDYLPALKSALAKEGVEDVNLKFAKDKINIAGLNQAEECWQVMGSWKNGQRQFDIYFPQEDINKQKLFSCAASGGIPSTLESFMIDERKVTLDLLVMYTVQRLNAEKWLAKN